MRAPQFFVSPSMPGDECNELPRFQMLELPPEEIEEEGEKDEETSDNEGSLHGDQEDGRNDAGETAAEEVEDEVDAKERGGSIRNTIADDAVEDNQWWDSNAVADDAASCTDHEAKYGGEDGVAEDPWLDEVGAAAGGEKSASIDILDEVILSVSNINSIPVVAGDEVDDEFADSSERWQTFDVPAPPPPTPILPADPSGEQVDLGLHDLARSQALLKEESNTHWGPTDAGKQMQVPHDLHTPTWEAGRSSPEKEVAGRFTAKEDSTEKRRKMKNSTPITIRPPLVLTTRATPPPKVPPKKSPKEEKADAHAAKVEESVKLLSKLVSSISMKQAYRAPWMKPAAVVPDAWVKALQNLQGASGHAAAVAAGRCPDDQPKSAANDESSRALMQRPSFTKRGIERVQSQTNLLPASKDDSDLRLSSDALSSAPKLPKQPCQPRRITPSPGLGTTHYVRPPSEAEVAAASDLAPLDAVEARDTIRPSPTPGLTRALSPTGGLARGNNAATRRRREEAAALAAAAAAVGKHHKTAAAAAQAAAEAYNGQRRARPASAGFLIETIANRSHPALREDTEDGENSQRVESDRGQDQQQATAADAHGGVPPPRQASADGIGECSRQECPSCLTARVGGGYIAIGYPGIRNAEEELRFPNRLPPCRDCGRELDYSILTGERLYSPGQMRLRAERAALAAANAARLEGKLADLRSGKMASSQHSLEADTLDALARAVKLASHHKAAGLALRWQGDRGGHGKGVGGLSDDYNDDGGDGEGGGEDDDNDDDDNDDDDADDTDGSADDEYDDKERSPADRVMDKYNVLGLWRKNRKHGQYGEHSTLEEILLRPGGNRSRIYDEARRKFQRNGCVAIFKLHISGTEIPGLVSPVAVHAAIVYFRACFRLRLWSRSGINAANGVTLLKSEGSKLFAFATTVEDAVLAGFGAQHICRDVSANIPAVTARISVALSSGTIIFLDEDDYYGNPVMVASQLAGPDIGIPDEIVCSSDCFESVMSGGLRLEHRTHKNQSKRKKPDLTYGKVSFPPGTTNDAIVRALGMYAERLPADTTIRTVCGVHEESPLRVLLRLVPTPSAAGRFASVVAAAGGMGKHARWIGAARKARENAPRQQITAADAPDALVAFVTSTLKTTGVVVQVMLTGFAALASKYGVLHFLTLVLHLRRIVLNKSEEHHCVVIRFAAEKAVLRFDSIEFAVQHIDAIRNEILQFNETVVGSEYWPGGYVSEHVGDYSLNVTVSAAYGDFIVLGTDIFGDGWDECKYLTEKAGKERHVVVSPHFEAEFTLRNSLKEDYMEQLHCVFVHRRAVAPPHEVRMQLALRRRNSIGADANVGLVGPAGGRRGSIVRRRRSSISSSSVQDLDGSSSSAPQTPPMRVRRGSLPHSGKLLGVEAGGIPEHYRMLMHSEVDSDAEEDDSELDSMRHRVLLSRISVMATHEFSTGVSRGAKGSTHFHHAGPGASADAVASSDDAKASAAAGEQRRMRMEKLSKMSKIHIKSKRARMMGDEEAEERDEQISEMISDIMMFGD